MKTYKGWELIKAIQDGEIKDAKIKWTDITTGICGLIEVVNKGVVWKPGEFSTKHLIDKDMAFEVVEEDIDIQAIEEFIIPRIARSEEEDMWNNRIKINELIKAVKQLDRREER